MIQMTPEQFGEAAFNNGIKRAPYQDTEFLKTYIAGLKVGEGGDKLMKQWLKGWDKANLSQLL